MDDMVSQIDTLKKFADDTKLGKTVRTEKDREELQEALDQLCAWADKWGMVFNVGKCKVMYAHGPPEPRLQLHHEGASAGGDQGGVKTLE
jgi:hypothetical protein